MSGPEVIIVGAGPVGLSTALFLAGQGVPPLVVEKHGGTSPYPRAATSMRTLETLRRFGLGTALGDLGWVNYGPLRAIYKDRAVGGTTMSRVDASPRFTRRIEECSPVESRMISQDLLEQVLLREIRRLGGEVRFDTRLADLEQDDDEVRAQIVNLRSGSGSTLRAKYLIAADGAGSGVRELLGIGMPDKEFAGHMITAFYRAELGEVVKEWGSHLCVVRNPDVYATMYSYNGRDRWSSHFMSYPERPDGPVELGAARATELLHSVVGDRSTPIELQSVNPWVASLGVASAFRRGRVFLAGDAAHVQTSAGGLGMNTGIQDGHNLAWKLAAVLHGQAARTLLDSYEPERMAAAGDSVALSRAQFHAFVGGSDEVTEVFERTAIDYLRGMMFYRYRSDAVLPDPDGEGELDVLDERARCGHRFPHHWLHDDGGLVSTIDLSGPNWLLLAGEQGEDWVWAAANAARSFGIELSGYRVVRERSRGADLADPAGIFPDVAGIGRSGAVLVRPDGFGCWRSEAAGIDARRTLESVLRTVLGLDG